MPPQPPLEELIAILKQNFPHLSDEALKKLATQQLQYVDLPVGMQGQHFPKEKIIQLDPDEPDLYKTAMHELAHVPDYGGDYTPDISSQDPRAFTKAFQIAASTFGADQALMNVAGLPSLETPGYLQSQVSLGNQSIAQLTEAAANDPGWGVPESFAETFAQTAGDWSLMPPSTLPFLAFLGSPSDAPAQTSFEQLQEQAVKLPPKESTPTTPAVQRRYKVPKRSVNRPPGLRGGRSKSKPKTKPPTRVSARSSRIRSRTRTRRF